MAKSCGYTWWCLSSNHRRRFGDAHSELVKTGPGFWLFKYNYLVRVSSHVGTIELSAGKAAINRYSLILAKALIKIALGEYSTGFHIHLCQDLDTDQLEAIRIVLR